MYNYILLALAWLCTAASAQSFLEPEENFFGIPGVDGFSTSWFIRASDTTAIGFGYPTDIEVIKLSETDYRLVVLDAWLLKTEPDPLTVGNERPQIPTQFTLSVYPNPFNSSTTITLSLPSFAEEIELSVYNVLGEVVRQMMLPAKPSPMTYDFAAADLPSGIYILQAATPSLKATTKLMLLK